MPENNKAHRIFRKFVYFFENKTPVHFVEEKTGEFRNGYVLDLNENKLTLVLNEFERGEMPFLLEEIKESSIVGVNRKEVGGWK